MTFQRKNLHRATLSMIGAVIGAGLFAVGPALGRMGIVRGSILFWVMAAVACAVHLLFQRIVVRLKGRHRLPGYIGKIFGERGKRLVLVTHAVHLTGVQWAYLLLGGAFLQSLVFWKTSPAIPDLHTVASLPFIVVFWGMALLCIAFGLKILGTIETILTRAMLVFIGVVWLLGLVTWSPAEPLLTVAPSLGTTASVAGIFLFAVFALGIIPEIHEIAGRDPETSRRSILMGSLLAALAIWLFGLAHLRLLDIAPHGFFASILHLVFPLVGFLAIITSLILDAYDLEMMYRYDFGVSRWLAWPLAIGIPFVCAFAVSRDFGAVISLIGAISTTANGLFVTAATVALDARDKRTPYSHFLVPYGASALLAFIFFHRIFQMLITH